MDGALTPRGRATGTAAVEIVGPAGAGKTTIVSRLVNADRRVERLRIPPYGYAAAACILLPTIARLGVASPAVGVKDTKRMLLLTAVARAVDRARRRGTCSTLLLDEGPVYMLARMRVLGAHAFESAEFSDWTYRTADWWARQLDLVVLLDATNAALVQRIRHRRQPPPIAADDRGLSEFLTRYRATYELVLDQLIAAGPVRVVRIDTGSTSPDAVAQTVRRLLTQSAAAA